MAKTTFCPVSDEPAELSASDAEFVKIECPRCGQFKISRTALVMIKGQSRADRETLLNNARRDAQGGVGIPFIRNLTYEHQRSHASTNVSLDCVADNLL